MDNRPGHLPDQVPKIAERSEVVVKNNNAGLIRVRYEFDNVATWMRMVNVGKTPKCLPRGVSIQHHR